MGQNKGWMRVSRAINVRSKKENTTMPSIATIGLVIRSFLSPRTVRRMINSFGAQSYRKIQGLRDNATCLNIWTLPTKDSPGFATTEETS